MDRASRPFPFRAGSVERLRARTMAASPIAELLQLPQAERLALAMALWDSLDEDGRSEALPLDSDLLLELDQRWAAHLENPAAAVPWDQVRSQLDLG